MAKYGIIYIIQNEFHPSDVYKIGYTTNSIHERVDELNRETSNPGRFKVCGYFPVTDVTEVEKLCHQHLGQMGFAQRKEFFKGSISLILTEVERIYSPFRPRQFISKEYMNGEIKSDKKSRRKAVKCNACSGKGSVRESQGFITIERSCSDCCGSGMVWIS